MNSSRPKPVLPLQATNLLQSIDLSMMTVRNYFGSFYKVTVPFAVVAAVLTYSLNHYFNLPSIIVFPIVLQTMLPLGNLLVRKVALEHVLTPAAFSPDIQEELERESVTALFFKSMGWQLLMQLCLLLFLIPGLYLSRMRMFQSEQRYFDNRNSKIQKRVWKELAKQEIVALEGAGVFLLMYWGMLTMLGFFALDLGLTLLFNYPIFFMRFWYDADFFYLIWLDPYVMTTWVVAAILTFPVVRIAWMLCYISLRVKHDCWDISTSLQREATRLQVS